MKILAAVLVLCIVSANAYLGVDINVAIRDLLGKVFGGRNAGPTGWQVSIVAYGWYGNRHFCGGTIIDPWTVLTAAQCCVNARGKPRPASAFRVRYDGLNRNNLRTTQRVSEVFVHHQYNSWTMDNDFCILRLRNKVRPSGNVRIVPIIDRTPPNDAPCQLTGWGTGPYRPDGLSIWLQIASLSIWSHDRCNRKWRRYKPVTNNMICAYNTAANGCNGDSGGPLMCGGKLCGVLSWGAKGCPGRDVWPTVYADPACPSGRGFIDDYNNKFSRINV